MELLNKIKIILDLKGNFDHDELMEIYIQNAMDYILDYTQMTEIPSTLESVIVEMVIYQYRQRGSENMSTESKGSLYESLITEYPNNIRRRLNPHKRVRVV